VSPTPSTTPTPTPTPTPVPTQAQGSGTIAVTGGQGSFNFSVAQKVGRKKPKQSFTYSDPIAGINFSVKKISGLTINSHHTQFTGTAKLGRKNKPTFTVDVDDLGPMGMNDQFSIQLSTGYSAGGVLTSGDITVH